ncbi:MAG TPA: hypothetical protein VFA57_17395 [Pseudolabrys sp.]|jgi:hypothetical protein|nr:hypothetical protein [Pseudolabrys sp.]
MFAPLFAVPLVVHIAASDSLPHWDVSASCKGAAAAAGSGDQGQARLKSCLESEARTKTLLEKAWAGFSAKDRAQCIKTIQWFEPTYTELAACLEMGRDAKTGEPVTPLRRPKSP